MREQNRNLPMGSYCMEFPWDIYDSLREIPLFVLPLTVRILKRMNRGPRNSKKTMVILPTDSFSGHPKSAFC